jgi:hypothetical protein
MASDTIADVRMLADGTIVRVSASAVLKDTRQVVRTALSTVHTLSSAAQHTADLVVLQVLPATPTLSAAATAASTSSSSTPTSPADRPDLWTRPLTIMTMTLKFAHAVTQRFGTLFAPFLAVAYGVDTESFLHMLGLAGCSSLANGLFSPLLDVFNLRHVFAVANLLICVGMMVGFFKGLSAAGLSFFLFYWGTGMSQPTIQSIVSTMVPANKLGGVTGFLEASWPLAGLIGYPLVGLILDYSTFNTFLIIMLVIHGAVSSWLLVQFTAAASTGTALHFGT